MFTALIVSAWAIQSIRIKKFIFRKTILDLPLLSYLVVLLISSLFSIDPRTSIFGYYGRFNGGLLSQVCYVVLYWAFVSNLNKKQALHTTYYILLSTLIASLLAIGEHFGIFTTCGLMGLNWFTSCWVQDVSLRVFSTLGQPNWLAALLVAIIPFTWFKSYKYYLISVLFFVTLLFTGSRSGLLAFGIEFAIFLGFILKKHVKILSALLITITVLLLYLFPNKQIENSQNAGGTESGTIRKYVWQGAWQVFLHHPIIGTGPETFAYSFPMYKPLGHNLTSEWDFINNKAHNEYLNYLANTGLLGFISYILIIIASLIILLKSKRIDLLAGYIGILITNFFGFSVVPISLLLFLFPAIAITNE